MNPQDALQLLDQVCSQVSLPREGHVKIQMALEALRQEIKKPEKKAEKK